MTITFFLVTLFIILLADSCRRKLPEQPPTDPCKDKTSFKAGFTIEEIVGDTSFVTDKALAPGYVLFRAQGTYDSVQWFIGGPQNTSANRNHVLYFQNPEGPVDVTFIGYRKPDTQCFPNDKATDTVHKTVTILPRNESAAIVGRFHGYNESNPADTFSVTISYYDNVWGYFIKNLPKGCPGYTTGSESNPKNIGLTIKAGFSGFQINENSVVCATVSGYGKLKGNDTLEIKYSARPFLSTNPYTYGERSNFKFIGIRKP
ncbi:hypothetical protein [Hydrotalea sp.]|uniref:hypothetical protein n=1 Tax=Hydrotalea sp. TaxID=2881279 RepID=UPI002633F433|nr:hypothetical protein [Hydrotalea sp.]